MSLERSGFIIIIIIIFYGEGCFSNIKEEKSQIAADDARYHTHKCVRVYVCVPVIKLQVEGFSRVEIVQWMRAYNTQARF